MIIGHGDIAKVLKDREDRLYFASGVSNSKETREEEYLREKKLLMEQDPYQHIVYFSSLSVFYLNSRYVQHKIEMEGMIKDIFPNYTIVRLGNITWGKNPYTIINYFKNRKKKNLPIQIIDTYRYLITKEEFLHWIDLIPEWNCEMNITGKMMTIEQILDEYI